MDWCLAATFSDDTTGQLETKAVPREESARIDGERQVYLPEYGTRVSCRILDRATLARSDGLVGPAIIEDPESTILALPGDRLSMSERGDVIIAINARESG